ncbi:hypothetical protein AB0958_21850 [Streptomyces sp. NPDC006655]|uniref:hypothetical protein n=1 Tax=Streptomyces sp. NPDC006655 TaxID=3156898 RepID=UPI003455FE63
MQELNNINYSITAADGNGNVIMYLQFTSDGGMTDDAVLALVTNLRNFAWPSAMEPVGVSANRVASTAEVTQFGVNTNPPVFS